MQARLALLNDHNDKICLELDGSLIRDFVPDVRIAENLPAHRDVAGD